MVENGVLGQTLGICWLGNLLEILADLFENPAKIQELTQYDRSCHGS